MSEAKSTAELEALVADLSKRLTSLESEVNFLKAQTRVPDDVMVAISAAVAAFLGHKANVKAVHLIGSHSYAYETRFAAHNRRAH